MRGSWLILMALLLPALAGCIQPPADVTPAASTEARWLHELDDLAWDTKEAYSKPLNRGALEILPGETIALESFDKTRISMAVWRPDVAEGVKVPVILDVGPYYGDGMGSLNKREETFFMEFVKHGYAYGRVAVRGTSSSGGCMEFFSMNEQKDVDAAVTWFGEQPWSNGNVGLYGASYDGTTPWIAAAFGNPHLKTIVPVSGLSDVAGLMFRNGTSESRGPIMHSVVYWPFGFQTQSRSPADKLENFCPEAVRGFAAGPYTAATGDRAAPGPLAGYWEDRDFRQRVKDNYHGSVYLVHGLQDWNVEPSMAYPFVTELEEQGIEVKHMLGQWGHDWPDRAARKDHVRWDWSEVLLRWFDRYLYENPARATGPGADVEDNRGNWRTEDTWPPRDAVFTPYYLGAGALASEPQANGEAITAHTGVAALTASGAFSWSFELPASDAELRFAGLAQLHVTIVPAGPDGNILAELLDVGDGKTTRVAHAVMNIRYHEGGLTPKTVTPGQPIVAKMEFFPADVVIPAGHKLVLRISPNTNTEPMVRAPVPMKIEWGGEKSILNLPIIVRDVGAGTYPGQP